MINETLEADRAYRKDKDEAYERGYAQGKADAAPHWIPCSERLPEEEGFYLVTFEHEYGAETNIRFFRYENGKLCWSLWGNENITAWMPKPEPYKGGDGMSVLLDWAMPKACRDCSLQIGGYCQIYSDESKRIDDVNLIVERPDWCPLVEAEGSET